MGTCCGAERWSPQKGKTNIPSADPSEKPEKELAPGPERVSPVTMTSETQEYSPTPAKSTGFPTSQATHIPLNRIDSHARKTPDEPTAMFVKVLTAPLSKKYRTLSILSNESHTKVILAEHLKSNQKRIIRQITKLGKAHESKAKLSQEEKFRTEMEIAKKLDHPNILKLFEVYEDRDNFYVVSEALLTGNILDHIVLSKSPSECMMARIMLQVLSAVHYCHINGVIHRNLNLNNLLLESVDLDGNVQVKVSGFGMSCLLSDEAKLNDRVGCAYFIAPEVLKKSYNEKCDVWSCGVMLYFLLSGTQPFTGSDNAEILRSVSQGFYTFPQKHWSEISPEAINLINLMLVKNPVQRLSVTECINHPWIQKFRLPQSVSAKPVLTALQNMKSFIYTQKLKKAILSFIADNAVSKEETKTLTDSFASIDTNGDGVLSREELIHAYSMTMTREQAIYTVSRVMRMVDFDESGNIDYSEFILASLNRKSLISEANLTTAFTLFDTEKSGKIPLLEFIEKLKEHNKDVGEEEWTMLTEGVDLNKDGKIDFQEFKELVQRAVSRKQICITHITLEFQTSERK